MENKKHYSPSQGGNVDKNMQINCPYCDHPRNAKSIMPELTFFFKGPKDKLIMNARYMCLNCCRKIVFSAECVDFGVERDIKEIRSNCPYCHTENTSVELKDKKLLQHTSIPEEEIHIEGNCKACNYRYVARYDMIQAIGFTRGGGKTCHPCPKCGWQDVKITATHNERDIHIAGDCTECHHNYSFIIPLGA